MAISYIAKQCTGMLKEAKGNNHMLNNDSEFRYYLTMFTHVTAQFCFNERCCKKNKDYHVKFKKPNCHKSAEYMHNGRIEI